jgi:bacillopeptidase F
VYVTKDDGVTLDRLATWTGSGLTWTPQSVDLLAYVGQQVYLIFKLDSSTLNRSGGDAGWWLDEMQVKEVSAPPSIISITPGEGGNLSGIQTIHVDAADDEGVEQVDFKIDGTDLVGQDFSSPFSYDWNSDWVFNGAHTFTATAYDADKQSASATVNWTTSNNGLALPYAEDFATAPGAAWRIIDENGAGSWKFKSTKGYGNSGGMYMGMNTTYDDNESDWFISPTVSIAAGQDAGMGFLHKYDIETGYDYAQAFITTDLNTWTQLGIWSARNQPYSSYGANLNSYAGQKVKLAWYFSADGGLTYEGWYLDEVRLQARPKVTSAIPNPVTNGQQLTINGTGFGGGTAHDFPAITISGTAATVISWNDTQIKVTVPAAVPSGDIVITNHGMVGDGFPLKVKLPAPGTTGLGQL